MSPPSPLANKHIFPPPGFKIVIPALGSIIARMAPRNRSLSLLTELFYSEMPFIAGGEEKRIWLVTHADARRRAGDQQVAGIQRHKPTNIGYQLPHCEYHSPRIAGLHAPTVEVQEHLEILRIADFIRGYEPRSDRPKCVATLALVPLSAALQLKRAFRHVIGKHVAGDHIERVFLAHISGRAAENDPQ